jgi:hypothetical protein
MLRYCSNALCLSAAKCKEAHRNALSFLEQVHACMEKQSYLNCRLQFYAHNSLTLCMPTANELFQEEAVSKEVPKKKTPAQKLLIMFRENVAKLFSPGNVEDSDFEFMREKTVCGSVT